MSHMIMKKMQNALRRKQIQWISSFWFHHRKTMQSIQTQHC